MAKKKNDRRRKAAKAAGAGLLLYLLLRGGGALGAGPGGGRPRGGAGVPCELRLDRDGLTLDGEPLSIAEAVSRCEPRGEVKVIVTGEALYGDAQALHEALGAADIAVAIPTQGGDDVE